MQINFNEIVKEQLVFVALPIMVIALGIIGIGYFANSAFGNIKSYNDKTAQIQTLTEQKTQLEADLARLIKEEANPEAKKVFTVEGLKFGVEASFAPLFDDMITIAKASNIRIRSVDYNYAPQDDEIFKLKVDGLNTCELTTTIVGTYSEIQTFLKTLLSEDYLVNIAQVEIVSWQRDKSVLIANLKIRYYTKTN